MRRRVLASVCLAGALAAASGSQAGAAARATAVAPRPSRGCAVTARVAPGETKVSLRSGGVDRWYLRHVPATSDAPKPLPVVIDLHGYAEGAPIHTRMTQLGPFGDTHGFITVTPQGAGAVARWDTGLRSADMRFVGDLLDDVERTLCVDQRRVFVTGLSDGAFMTSAVACAYADRVAAAAPVAGISNIAGCKPARRVPVVAFHGTADGFVAFDGGLGAKALDLPAPDGSGRSLRDIPGIQKARKGASIPAVTAAWAKRNGCRSKPIEQQVAADVTLVRFRCPQHADVQLYRITGGGHAWPGSAFSRGIAAVVGPTTMSISADEVIWRFFEGHPLR